MSFKQAGRLLQFSSSAGTDVLLAESIEGVEGVSRLFSFHVELSAEFGAGVDPNALVGTKATMSLALRDAQGTRYFNGLIASFEQNPSINSLDKFSLRLVPSLWQLTLATNCRVFHDKTVMEIIKAVISPYALSVGDVTEGAYKPMDYCTQFNETDFNFISRLAEQFGIFYWFEHSDGDNKVIFGDSLGAYGMCKPVSAARYVQKNQDLEHMFQTTVDDFRLTASMVTGKHTAGNWDFRVFQAGNQVSFPSVQQTGQNAMERYSWPAGDSGLTKLSDKLVSTPAHASFFTGAQRDASDVNAELFHGGSTARWMTAGYVFSLNSHPHDEWNSSYYLTEVAHHATQSPGYDTADHAEVEAPYANRFVCIQSGRQFRPEYRTPKPKMYGPQNAIVVAPSGEDYYIDKFGRVNVRFLWDRSVQNFNSTDNTYVRVAQPWAGPRTGTFFYPRIDDEVLVQFVDGDPDDPVVIGSVFNKNAMPRYALPDMSTRTGIYTRSSKGGTAQNANELRFEDKAGSEQIFINAEKDLDLNVENDRRTHVYAKDSLMVDKDQMEQIGGSYVRSIGGNTIEKYSGKHDVEILDDVTHKYDKAHNLHVGGDSLGLIDGKQGLKITGAVSHEYDDSLSLKIGQNHGQKVGMNYALDAGMNAYIKGGMNVTIEAGLNLTLKGPGGFITIGPAGVAISGTMVLINSGGAAGAGEPPNIIAPDAPPDPQSPAAPDKADDGSKGGKM